jgi:hypothetical protein
MGKFDKKIFGKVTFSNLLEEIYNNQKKKEEQISILIHELKPMVQEIGDATLIVPLIKEYLEIGVKNDEALIKMATIVQRATQAEEGGEVFGMTEAEKQQLLDEVKKYNEGKDKK